MAYAAPVSASEGMRFNDLIEMLIKVVDADSSERSKIESRFRSYRRLSGLIPEFGTGKGCRATYSLDTAWKAALLFEFSTIGIPVEAASLYYDQNSWAWQDGVTSMDQPWLLPDRTSTVQINMARIAGLVISAWKAATQPVLVKEPRVIDRIDIRPIKRRKKMEAAHG